MKNLILVFALLLCPSAFAALPATAQWDVRTTGNDTNGGCFDPAVATPGTDFSQQDTAQVAFADLVIGTTTTQLTSAANPFTSTSVGNCINITAGTGFTVGRYNVRSVAAGVATMDRAVGTAASTGGTGNLGGSMASPMAGMAAIVSGNMVWLKSGTYTVTATVTNTAGASFSFSGYSSTHGDNVSGAIITTATNSTNLITITASTANAWINNIALSNTATTRGVGILNNSGPSPTLTVSNCTLTGFTFGIGAETSLSGSNANLIVLDTSISGSSNSAIATAGTLTMIDSVLSGSTAAQIASGNSAGQIFVIRSLIVGGSSHGITNTSNGGILKVIDSTIAFNAGNGISLSSATWNSLNGLTAFVQNSILFGNGTFGFSVNTDSFGRNVLVAGNGVGGNTSGNYQNVPAGVGDITLTGDPFTNHSTGDYSLNSAAGSALKGTGFPGTFPGGASIGHLDVGPVQSSSGAITIINNYGQSN